MVSALLFLLSCSVAQAQENKHPFTEIQRNPNYIRQLQKIVAAAVALNFGEHQPLPENLGKPFTKPLALFVTARKAGKVLGCMGTLRPKEGNLAQEIATNLEKAFSMDPRHHPIQRSDTPGMEIYITAVSSPRQVTRWDTLNPARDSIWVRHGNKEAVVLAGEAKTLRYLLAFAKAKAGIKKNEAFQVYRLQTKTLMVKLP